MEILKTKNITRFIKGNQSRYHRHTNWNPEVIILDEPFANLTTQFRLKKIIKELAADLM
jgi:ABC-type uncharacterized transport system ATPase subunit